MAFSVQEFRSQLAGDGARPNLFEIEMPFPDIIAAAAAGPGAGGGGGAGVGGITSPMQKLTFMARSSQLPGSTMGMAVTNYFGREIKVPGNRTFPEWTITVINDEDFITRNTFERWMDALNSHAGNLRAASAVNSTDYCVDAKVKQFAKDGITGVGGVIKEYDFIGMFPIDISPIDLDWGDNDSIEQYTVTLVYQWWESDTTT